MTLITRQTVRAFEAVAPEDPHQTPVVATRPGIGSTRYDVVLIAPVAGPATTGRTRRDAAMLARLFNRMRIRTTVGEVPDDGASTVPTGVSDAVRESLCVAVVVEEDALVGSAWLWWILGGCESRRQRLAVLPIARRDPFRRLWPLAPPLARLPYLGLARAVGDRSESLWVIPAGQPPESRDALNFEYWLHERHLMGW